MSKRLHVGNLSDEVDEAVLESAFAEWGGSGATIPYDSASGRSKGFGFIQVEDRDVAAAISAMNGKELGGTPVTVREAQSRLPGGNSVDGSARS